MYKLDAFDYMAFVVMAVLLATVVVIIVLLGALPGRIAAGRKHPYATAIAAAGWISVVSLGTLWPLAFIWTFIPPRSSPAPGGGGPSS